MNSLKKKVFILLFVLLFSFIAKADDKMRIAVLTLEPENVSDTTAKMVSDILRTELLNTGLFRVLERGEMDAILKEQAFQQSGCTETACAVKIGKLLSANKMLIGTVGKLGEKFIISGRIVDVEKGELEFSDDVQVYSEGALIDAAKELATRLAGRIKGDIKTGFRTAKDKNAEKKEISQGDIYGQIIKTNGNRCVIDIGTTSGVAKGQRFQIMDPIEKEYIDKITGEKTTGLEGYEKIGLINITEVEREDAQGEMQNIPPAKEIMGKQIKYLGIPLFEISLKFFSPMFWGTGDSQGYNNHYTDLANFPGFNIDCKIGQREQGGNWVFRFSYQRYLSYDQEAGGQTIQISDTESFGEFQQYYIQDYSLAAGYFYKPFSKGWSFLYTGLLAGYEYYTGVMNDIQQIYISDGNGNQLYNIYNTVQQKNFTCSGIGVTLVLGFYIPPIPSWPVLLNIEFQANHKFMFNNQNILTSSITGDAILPSVILQSSMGLAFRF